VGLAYNIKKGNRSEGEDAEAEYDTIDTIDAIKVALEESGCTVQLLEANKDFIHNLEKSKPDIVFNIAEGLGGRGREAHIPAILSFLGIPYTGSDEITLGIALDKALTKRVLASYGIKTPGYQVISDEKTAISTKLGFPLIVKPNAEGSSKGIFDTATAENPEELGKLVAANLKSYRQPMLVEEFVSGREFTVAVVGNGQDIKVFPPMEVKYKDMGKLRNIYSFDVKKNFRKYIEYECPPRMDKRKIESMQRVAASVFNVLQCRDFSRVDFRMDDKGMIHFIEINPLPGLAPGYSDFILIASYNGHGYAETVRMVLNTALKRYGMRQLN